MAEATAKTTAAPDTSERRVKVKLLNDVWISDPGHPEAGADGIRRVRTNILTLDDEGNPIVDKKTKNFICTQVEVDLPVSVVKSLLTAGKAERLDPL